MLASETAEHRIVLEFTGERVVPGQVESDLWNEHISRYLFAARLAAGKRVADLGCGTGYGCAELARSAASVCGFDISPDAVEYARAHYAGEGAAFQVAAAENIPRADASFDVVVSFEVIEHLADGEALVREARRLVPESGQFVVSTPNRDYYAESRGESGPNPFHCREYSLDDFRQLLERHFAHVTLYTQNHAAVIAFAPIDGSAGAAVVEAGDRGEPEVAHFFIAVCSPSPQSGSTAFLYAPTTSNVLRERALHIEKIQGFLEKSLAEHAALVDQYHDLEAQYGKLEEQLQEERDWAAKREEELAEKIRHIELLQGEVADRSNDLAKAVDQLHATERELVSRTQWAQSLDAENARLLRVFESRRVKLARKMRLVPNPDR